MRPDDGQGVLAEFSPGRATRAANTASDDSYGRDSQTVDCLHKAILENSAWLD